MGKIIAIGIVFILIVAGVFLTLFLLSSESKLILSDKLNSFRYNILGVETVNISGEIEPEIPLINSPLRYLGVLQKIPINSDQFVAVIESGFYTVKGVAVIDHKNRFVSWLPEVKITSSKGDWSSAGEVLDWWRFGYLDNDETTKELAVQFGIAGTASVHPFYLYTYKRGKDFELLLKLIEASNQIDIADLDSDGNKEIIHDYSISGIGKLERDLLRWKDIWKIENGEVKRVNNQFPHLYQSLKEIHVLGLTKKEWEPDARRYYPILRCLKEKADLTSSGILVGIDDCRGLLHNT